MRALHIIKTANGANWAADEAVDLIKLGVEVHVALPNAEGKTVRRWKDGGILVRNPSSFDALPASTPCAAEFVDLIFNQADVTDDAVDYSALATAGIDLNCGHGAKWHCPLNVSKWQAIRTLSAARKEPSE